jgi:hypothetical protein
MSRLDEIRKLLQSDPDDPFLIYATALELEHMEGPEKALSVLLNLRQAQPGYLPVYYKAAEIALSIQDFALTQELLNDGINLANKLDNRKTASELASLQLILNDEMDS